MHGHVPLSRKKAKTGCKTCKIRRVKCDEGRPACRRCVSTSRVCDGYGIWGGGGTPYGQPHTSRALSIYCTPVAVGNLSHEEQLCFDWLIKRTAKKFAGLFPSDFWESLIFQASAQEPAVRHAVIALSSTHRSQQEYAALPNKYDEECFTLRQYNKAIQHLRTNATNDSHSLRVALITCMLFITLEYMRGQYQMAGAHLQYGMKLLSDISTPRPPSSMVPTTLPPEEDFAYNALVDAYVRLGIQSAMFGHVPSHVYIVTKDPLPTSLPYIFSSLLEARRALDDLLNRVHCLKKHYHDHHASQTPTSKQQMLNTQSRILADLSLWGKTYKISVARLETNKISGKHHIGYLLLRVHYEMAVIMASVCLSPEETESEMIFDSYTENFIRIMTSFLDIWRIWTTTTFREEEILELANAPEDLKAIFQSFKAMSDMDAIIETSLLELLENSSIFSHYLKTPDCGSNGFTVEMGYIPPVYYTALKCRVPQFRRQAVRALRAAPHREGVWNGLLLADVLEEIIRIEEGDFYAGSACVNSPVGNILPTDEDLLVPKVPAEARVSDVRVLLPDDISGDIYVSYRKVVSDEWVTFMRKIGV
ncbi:transcriptional regulator family: Fungal Specific TF [Penicillium robsamsonii]|uniref:transcriptional regulator family: Fungal Specific TF n=1 Tax=Penicillium robsamsonii TaxID=1792511 RepID=UPI002546F987|nr:transcriptional regulator family: Fungal Specific TF [Penicillium robsamsonii]KAJ5824307.1 transcriptional regulator family: Fungal Specific TF [Penicillium robsamsonii]